MRTFAGYTPLQFATSALAAEAVASLLAHGADVNAKNWIEGRYDWLKQPPGTTALHLCALRSSVDMAICLLQHFVSHQRALRLTG